MTLDEREKMIYEIKELREKNKELKETVKFYEEMIESCRELLLKWMNEPQTEA